MADPGHDAVFVEDAAALRPRLELCARVLQPGIDGDFGQADQAVDRALAETYALGLDGDRTVAAFRALLHPARRPIRPRRSTNDRIERAERVELFDVDPRRSGSLADDLAALGPTAQAVVAFSLLGRL